MSEEVIALVLEHKERFLVQIDLHGLTDEYLEWFTGVPDTLSRIQKNIKIMADNDVKMRVSTIITRKNYREIPAIADWIHEAGGKIFGISPVINIGRATVNEDLILSREEMIEVNDELEAVNQKYPNFISVVVEARRENTLNCGCLTSHVVISARGNVKICTMDNMEYFNSVIGNVLEEDVFDIFDRNMEYMVAFSRLRAPDHEYEQCKECIDRSFCSKCILRGMIRAKERKGECRWYKEIVPEVIKRQLRIV